MGRPKKKPDDKKDKTPKKKNLAAKDLPPLPGLNLESSNLDKNLANTIIVVYISLVDIEHVAVKDIIIEEKRCGGNFLYFLENKKKNLTGYIGRAKNGNLTYLIMDKSRFKWALAEGFIKNINDLREREFVFNKIGVFREVDGLMDFIKFLSGKPQFEFKGDYILTPQI